MRVRKEFQLFKEIWNEREHVSWLSGRKLIYFDVKCFAHVVAKSKGEKFKLMKDNIILLHPEDHTLLDQGTIKARQLYEEKYNCNFGEIEILKNIIYDINKDK